MNRPLQPSLMGYRGLAVMGEPPANAAGTRQRIPLRLSGICFSLASVLVEAFHVGLDSFNVQLDNGRLSFVAQQEVAAPAAGVEALDVRSCTHYHYFHNFA